MSVTATAAEPASGEARRAWRPWLLRLFGAAASGVLLYLSFAPRPLWWLAPLAFAGWALVAHGRRFWGGFGYGFVFGLGWYIPLFLWLNDFLGAEFGPLPWLGVSAALAAWIGLCGGLNTWVARLPGAPVWMALVVVAIELPRSVWPLGGFAWGRIGFTQPEGAYLPLASIGGAPLVGFAVVVTGFALAALVRARRRGAVVTAAVAAVLPLAAGLAVWPSIGTEAQQGTLTVAIVQGNAPDVGLALLGRRTELRENHLVQSERLLADIRAGRVPKPDLVVWPETATDVVEGRRDPELDRLSREFGVPMLIGAVHRDTDGNAQNSMIVWDPETGPGERYSKQQLVPFGEYVPARDLARLVTPFVDDTGDMLPGSGEPPALHSRGLVFGATICYEVAFDYPARDATLAGAEVLFTPTNNAWYGVSEMSYQQLAMSRLRAVEHGRAVVVPATSGVSAIVAPDGGVTRPTSLFTAASLVETVPLRQQTTLSDQLGAWTDVGVTGLAVAGVLAGGIVRIRTRRSGAGASEHTMED
ncbi:apolipoprotein N-acyltransferase [Amycolatopsis lurida]